MSITKRRLEKVWEELGTQPEIRFGTDSEPVCPKCKGIGFFKKPVPAVGLLDDLDDYTMFPDAESYDICECRK